jgi:hypothetical protein
MGAGQLRRRGWDPRRTAQIGSGRADASTQARRTPSASLGGLSGPNSNLAAPARRIKAAHETTTAANVSGPNRTRTQEPAPGGSAQQPLRVRDADVAEHASGSSAASSPNSSLSEAAGALETRTGRIHPRARKPKRPVDNPSGYQQSRRLLQPLAPRGCCDHREDLRTLTGHRLGSALKVKRCRLNGQFAGKALQESPPRRRVACVSSMAAEARTADAGYTNRPAIHAQALWRVRLENRAGRHATGRAGDRMVLALRAYEQRAQRRAALHGWLVARSALTSRT